MKLTEKMKELRIICKKEKINVLPRWNEEELQQAIENIRHSRATKGDCFRS